MAWELLSPGRKVDPGRRLRLLAILAASATLLGSLALPIAWGCVFHEDDLGGFHLPLRAFHARCLALGDDPAWFPGLFCGFDLQGEGQAGLSHPIHGWLYGHLALSMAFPMELVLNYPALFVGTFLLLRRWALPGDAALFGALAFAFSGFNLLHYFHLNMIAIVAHIPWLLWGLDLAWRAEDGRGLVRGLVVVSALTASQLLLGYPQFVWFSALAEFSYLILLSRVVPGGVVGKVAGWIAAKALGLLGGAAQVLPTLDAFSRSLRDDPSIRFASINALHPANLVQLIGPYLFKARYFDRFDHSGAWPLQEFGLYDSAVVTVLLGWMALRGGSLTGPARSLWRWAWVLAVLAMVLACGRYTPIGLLLERLPIVGLFRCPSRAIVLFHLAAAVLAGLAFADLANLADRRQGLPWRRIWPLLLLPLASLLVALGLRAWVTWSPESALAPLISAPRPALIGPWWMMLATVTVLAAARGRRGALVVLVLLLASDQAVYGIEKMYRRVPPLPLSTIAGQESLPPEDGASWRTLGGTNLLTFHGRARFDGYAGLVPRRLLDADDPQTLRISGVGWIQTEPGGDWQKVADPLPWARLVTEAVVSTDPRRDLPRIDPAVVALVDRPLALAEDIPGEVQVLSHRPGQIDLETSTRSRQLLVLAESFHPGWNARVDGRLVPVRAVYGDFLGVVVGPGVQPIRFKYVPRSLHLGRRLSGLGATIIIVGLIGTFANRPGQQRKSPTFRGR
ncbi:hypothetical protein BH23PLA1_BH23PLA1_07910 [soil metagenome]